MSKSISVLILAAGASSRMKGDIKQLLPWGKSTLLENAIDQAKVMSDGVYVVLGAHAEEILGTISGDFNVIRNPDWQLGLGSSISYGLKHISSKGNSDGVLIMLADQPLIDSAYLQELLKAFDEKYKIVATTYPSGPGVPALFDNAILPELSALQGDVGARKVIKKHSSVTKLISPNGKEIDIDTKDNYIQITGIQNIKHE